METAGFAFCLKADFFCFFFCNDDSFKIQGMSAGVWQAHSTTLSHHQPPTATHSPTDWLTDWLHEQGAACFCLRLQLLHESLSDYEPKIKKSKKNAEKEINKMNNNIKRLTDIDAGWN